MSEPRDSAPVRGRRLLFGILALVLGVACAELALSAALVYRHRSTGALHDGVSRLSLLVLGERVLARLDLVPPPSRYQLARSVEPDSFLRPDSTFGYIAASGSYKHIYLRRERRGDREWERLPIDVRINADGSRWTGQAAVAGRRNILLLGDSFVFGSGVHDAQAFGYLLQGRRPESNVRTLALGGWGLAQAYVRMQRLGNAVQENDIVVIGYADYFDVRNVAAPSRLRDIASWNAGTAGMTGAFRLAPQVTLKPDGTPDVRLISENCAELGDYCQLPDPPTERLAAVSAALINGIARTTPAQHIFLLVMQGRRDNPVYALLDPRVAILWARSEDLPEFIRDDVEGFDSHPGPYWHYAIARLLDERLPR